VPDTGLFLALDLSIVFATLASAWLWWRASQRQVRRVTRDEVLDAADINRLVIALNRTQILNSRAALATAGAAVLAAIRVALTALVAG
jgi:hypothetical protein